MILGLSGKKGTGKTLAADYLVRDAGFTKVSFASKLKELSKQLFHFSQADLYGETKETPFKEYDWTPRDFMIKLGHFARYYEPNYWIKSVDLSARRVVIDDMRFINEAEFLKTKGAKLIRIERYESQNPYKTDSTDASECELDNYAFDHTIEKQMNGTKSELYRAVMRIYNSL